MVATPLPNFLGPPTPLVIAVPAVLPLVPTSGMVPGFSMERQAHSNWCWAAVTEAVLTLAGAGKGQDVVATEHIQANGRPGASCAGTAGLGSNNMACAATPGCAAGCNDTHIIRFVLTEQGQFKAILSSGGMAPTYPQIRGEVARNKPVIVVINWPPQGGVTLGHFVAVTGWQDAAGKQYVDVYVPANAVSGSAIRVRMILYSDLVSNYNVTGSGGKAVFSYSVI